MATAAVRFSTSKWAWRRRGEASTGRRIPTRRAAIVILELFDARGADDRGGDFGAPQDPGERDRGRRLPELLRELGHLRRAREIVARHLRLEEAVVLRVGGAAAGRHLAAGVLAGEQPLR